MMCESVDDENRGRDEACQEGERTLSRDGASVDGKLSLSQRRLLTRVRCCQGYGRCLRELQVVYRHVELMCNHVSLQMVDLGERKELQEGETEELCGGRGIHPLYHHRRKPFEETCSAMFLDPPSVPVASTFHP
jgi:hypothetical protein